MTALASNQVSASSPPNSNPPQKPANLKLDRRGWAAWQRDGQRYYKLLGFKAVGVVFAALLGLALWGDGVATRISTLSDSRAKLSVEVTKMKALVAARKKIEAALVTTREQHASSTARGLTAIGRPEAGAALISDLQAQMSALKITGAELNIADKPKVQALGPTVLVNATFQAIPEQIVNLLQGITSGARLYRVSDVQLDVDSDPASIKLKATMQVEAMYFVPNLSPKDKRNAAPAKVGSPAAPFAK